MACSLPDCKVCEKIRTHPAFRLDDRRLLALIKKQNITIPRQRG